MMSSDATGVFVVKVVFVVASGGQKATSVVLVLLVAIAVVEFHYNTRHAGHLDGHFTCETLNWLLASSKSCNSC